ncbi:hypothetical protein AC84_5663, partial [Escherichia coli 1-392-07_S4_C1]
MLKFCFLSCRDEFRPGHTAKCMSVSNIRHGLTASSFVFPSETQTPRRENSPTFSF